MMTADALDRLRRANPVADVTVLDDEELSAVVAACEAAIEGADQPPTVALEPLGLEHRRDRRRFSPVYAFAAAFAVALAVVGLAVLLGRSDGPDVVDEPSTTIATPTTIVTTTTLLGSAVEFTQLGDVEWASGLVYYDDGETVLETTVYRPIEGEGPWPVVIAYHDYCTSCSADAEALRLASLGAVVFSTRWPVVERSPSEYLSGIDWDPAACAVGFAQEHAAGFGGDVGALAVFGSGGGEHPAAWVAFGHADESSCALASTGRPTMLVVGTAQFIMQMDYFDPAFEEGETAGRTAVARMLDPGTWHAHADLSAILWTTRYTVEHRQIESDPGPESWVWTRDPSGRLVEDLREIGAMDDGIISYDDNAHLLQLRLERAGIDVALIEMDNASWGPGEEMYVAVIEALTAQLSGSE